MAVLSIASFIPFFVEEQKSIKNGESHYRSGHVESFSYSQGILRGDLHVRQNKFYKVMVSEMGSRILTKNAVCYLFTALKCFSASF